MQPPTRRAGPAALLLLATSLIRGTTFPAARVAPDATSPCSFIAFVELAAGALGDPAAAA